VVFVDLGLPRSHAYQLPCRLRREAGLHDVRIVALLTEANKDDARRLNEAGFNHYVSKAADRESIKRLLAPRLPAGRRKSLVDGG
jgi:CheY-like chemotaxis protein